MFSHRDELTNGCCESDDDWLRINGWYGVNILAQKVLHDPLVLVLDQCIVAFVKTHEIDIG